ncbi:hypothetical protein [Tenacibaculum finnmarkense]|nr:hypothetical protein [Tenacibaculum finnmarkense]
MDIVIEKKGKGHDVFINNQWHMWITGSKRNARKELEIYLKQQNE